MDKSSLFLLPANIDWGIIQVLKDGRLFCGHCKFERIRYLRVHVVHVSLCRLIRRSSGSMLFSQRRTGFILSSLVRCSAVPTCGIGPQILSAVSKRQ